MSELDIQLLIVGGTSAFAGMVLGLLIGLVRAHYFSAALRRELSSLNIALQNELNDAERELSGQITELRLTEARLTESHSQVHQLENQLGKAQRNSQALHIEQTRLHTQQQEREERHTEQIQLLSETKSNLKREFELLANKIFEDKGRQFTSTNRDSLESLLKPFREQITGFQSRINEVHTESVKGNTALEFEIKKVLEIGLEMNSQASNLATALKGDNKTMGSWGEAQLERTLELAGLLPGDHYETQGAYRDRQGRRRVPDFIIKLPDSKCMIIDSKVSLVDYERAISAESDQQQRIALDAHAKSVKNHIDELSAKDYSNLVGVDSPDFVLMFMPIEPAYIEAMKHNRDLFNYGYQRQVVMVSHTTLMPILRTVANLWMIDQSNREAREISSRAGDIFNQVCTVAERLQRLGNTLQAANNQYNKTVTGLSGKQGLYGKVERFAQLSGKASKNMVDLEPIHTDIEIERLEAIALARAETDTRQ